MGKIQGSRPRIATMSLAAVILGTNAAILGDTALDAVNSTVVSTGFAAQPDVARNLTVKGNDGNVTGNVVITGRNLAGETITETIALSGSSVVAGNKAFASVTSISLPKYAVANTERIRIGVGSKIGLPVPLSRNSVIAAFLGGVREATAPTVAFSPTALESNTVTLSSALAGSAVIVDYYETL